MTIQPILRRAVCVGALLLGFTASNKAHAATLTVTSTADIIAADGVLTLREALQSANNLADINVDAGANRSGDYTSQNLIRFSFPYLDPQTITLTGGELPVTSGAYVTIIGLGADKLSISANGSSRIFNVNTNAYLNMANLTLRDGSTPTVGLSTGAGSAIFVQEYSDLILQNCVISNNLSVHGAVHGVYRSRMEIHDTTFSNNKGGVALANQGTANLFYTNFRGNTATGFDNGNVGIANLFYCTFADNTGFNTGGALGNSNQLNLIGCTLAGNSSPILGGAITSVGLLQLSNCTISGNTSGNGGAAYVLGGTMTLNHCTLTGNKGNGGIGGIYNEGTVVTSNTIFNDINTNFGPRNGSGVITSLGHNLSNDTLGPNNGSTDKVSTNPKIGPLADNGSRMKTQTHALLAGSPAINAGGGNLSDDQRAVLRDATPDIGAYEFNSSPRVASVSPIDASDKVGNKRIFSVTVADANGVDNIRNIQLHINTEFNESDGATISYVPSLSSPTYGELILNNSLTTAWVGRPGPQTRILDNGAIRIDGTDVSISESIDRRSLTLTFIATIRDGLVGQNRVFARVQDKEGALDPIAPASTGYVRVGTYTVTPAFRSGINNAPTLSKLTPGATYTTLNSAGLAPAMQTFNFFVKDEDGLGDIQEVWFLAGKQRGWKNSATFVFYPRTRRLVLRSDDGNQFLGGGRIGSPGTIENSQVRVELDRVKMLVYPDGKSFGLSLPLLAKSGLLGQNNIWLRAQDRQNALAPNGDLQGYVLSGTWTVGQSSTPRATPSNGKS